MARWVAWSFFLLGVAHVLFGVIRYWEPLSQAMAEGFVGQFKLPEVRRSAFWFLMCGPLLMLVGHMAINAVTTGDTAVLRIIGIYGLLASAIGVLAFPVSPLWILLLLSGWAFWVGQGA